MSRYNPGIYSFVNKVNGHRYIGSSRRVFVRRNEHLIELRQGSHHSRYFQNAFNKYGEDSFTFEVLENCKEEELFEREKYYVRELRPVYNVMDVQETFTHSEATREKLRAAWKPNHLNVDAIRAALRGRILSRLEDSTSPERLVLDGIRNGKGYLMNSEIVSLITKNKTASTLRNLVNLGLVVKVAPNCYTLVEFAESPGFVVPSVPKAVKKPTGPMPEETKKKIAEANKGKVRTPEMREAARQKTLDYYASKALDNL